MAGYGLLLSLLLWAVRFIAWGEGFDAVIALRFVLFAFVMSLIINGFGWLGARWVWTLTTAGVAVGIAAIFIYANREMDGWGDLIGLLAFMECVVIGFALGLLADGVRFIAIKRREKA
jgi:hypothetical protein